MSAWLTKSRKSQQLRKPSEPIKPTKDHHQQDPPLAGAESVDRREEGRRGGGVGSPLKRREKE